MMKKNSEAVSNRKNLVVLKLIKFDKIKLVSIIREIMEHLNTQLKATTAGVAAKMASIDGDNAETYRQALTNAKSTKSNRSVSDENARICIYKLGMVYPEVVMPILGISEETLEGINSQENTSRINHLEKKVLKLERMFEELAQKNNQ